MDEVHAHEPATLAALLRADAVPLDTLHARYGPLLELVRVLIGVVPNCDRYLEIWPPAFRMYNVMVPNFLNLPLSIFGLAGPPAALVGIGLYVASRAAECPYCSAHTCSFALRRGASPEKMAQALVRRDAPFTAAEVATIAVARSLARVPCELTPAERKALEDQISPAHAEWIVAGIVMMGFLNKFMDAIGVELEGSTAAEVAGTIRSSGWSAGKAGRELGAVKAGEPPAQDTVWTKLWIVPHLPTALRLDGEWQRGVPDRWPAVGELLRDRTGHDFPVLSRLQHRRVSRAIATMVKDSLDAETSVMGLRTKVLAGVVFAAVVEDEALKADVRAVAAKVGVAEEELEDAARFARGERVDPAVTDPLARAALLVARAASPSPARIDDAVVDACRSAGLSAAAIVELVAWLSVLQMLHRLGSYYAPAAG